MSLRRKLSLPPVIINKNFLLDNNHYLYRDGYNSVVVEKVAPLDSIVFRGDFYGFLNTLEILPRLHYTTLLTNGLKNPQDFEGSVDTLRLLKKDIIPIRNTHGE